MYRPDLLADLMITMDMKIDNVPSFLPCLAGSNRYALLDQLEKANIQLNHLKKRHIRNKEIISIIETSMACLVRNPVKSQVDIEKQILDIEQLISHIEVELYK